MIKKILVTGIGVVTALGLLFGKDAVSYVYTSVKKVRTEAKLSVPLNFEIERARAMVGEIVPDIQKNVEAIAREEVEVDDLRDQIVQAEKNLAEERQRIFSLRAGLDNGGGRFVLAGRRATAKELETELARRFERFQTAEATVLAKRQLLEGREKSLHAAQGKLEGMLAAKRDLEIQVQNLDARLTLVQAAQAASPYQFDDSQLSRCKKLVQELRKRLDVAEKTIDHEGRLVVEVTTEPEPAERITERIDRYFGANSTASAADSTL